MKRVVITGLGTISALGLETKSFRDKLFAGVCGISPIERIEIYASRTKIGAEVKDFAAEDYFSGQQLTQLDRYSHFALIATREAMNHAQLTLTEDNAQRTAVVYGTGIGGQNTLDESFHRLYAEGASRLHPYTVPKAMASANASQISMDIGAKGPVFGATSACASSAHSIGVGLMLLRSGMADIAVVGGSEAPISQGALCAWEGLRVLAKDTCRPFSGKRGGMVLGEGAGTLVIETLDHALSRGAKIYAELVGFGCCADAGSLIQPCQDGMARAISLALDDAGLRPGDVAYINAHGTGTPQNDPTETAAIRQVFAEHADNLLVSSTKSMHGHPLGAASAIEAVATILAIQEQTAPPTIGYLEPDPACDLDYVVNVSKAAEIHTALSNSFGFGGLNAVLAFSRWNENQV